jgi:hypothetical protein
MVLIREYVPKIGHVQRWVDEATLPKPEPPPELKGGAGGDAGGVTVFVLAAPARASHRPCFESLEMSDIGDRYVVSMHPYGVHKNDHWRATHELAAKASTELVLVLEDDVLVNRNIVENIRTWRWPLSSAYGAGWLYNPGCYSTMDVWYRGPWEWAMTQAVLYRTEDLPKLIDYAWQRMQEGMPWDCAMAWAAHQDGRKIRVHYPSLAEHMNEHPSVVGNTAGSVLRTSRGTFEPEWLRPVGHEHHRVDRFGRAHALEPRAPRK